METGAGGSGLSGVVDENVRGIVEVKGSKDRVRTELAPDYETEAATAEAPAGGIFVVSPDGQIFLRYPTHDSMDATLEEAENIRLDLERTLKGSLI